MLWVIGRGSLQTLLAVRLVPGDLFMLAAVIGWAFYSWLLVRPPAHMRGASGRRPSRAGTGPASCSSRRCSACSRPACSAPASSCAGAAPIRWSLGVLAALLYVSLGASVAGLPLLGPGRGQGGPALAAFFNNLTPLFAALLSALVLGEPPQAYHAVAFVLIVGRHRGERRSGEGLTRAPILRRLADR